MARSTRKGGILVVAAVILRQGEVLIGQRRPGDWNEFKWEFPGGKVEAGESPRDALARELTEELGIQAEIGPEMTRYQHAYCGKPPIDLIFFRVESFCGEPQNLAFHHLKWEAVSRLESYEFLDGDVHFVRQLARGAF
jgi:mutator protein MutT